MTAILYPVAAEATLALSAPRGRAARERQALEIAGEAVAFVTEPLGPAYATRDAALDAYPGQIEDDRPGRTVSLPSEDRILRLVEQVAPRAGRLRAPPPVAPTFTDGHRWPTPGERPATVWRVMISYWRIGAAPVLKVGGPQARHARKRGRDPVDSDTLRAYTRQPLLPVKPQQPLDIGLFERRLPESPHIVVPDE
ncbi:MAG: hypothetical protein V4514_13530 [Pseudomonadota bacterium]|uniref:hypothetical protein n=1 Tax=unclassified Phenylobacterium TaxID=2640670 RepID=UPI0006F7275B|nr:MULTISPECIES: hypothetical protein [unclassified Phenylobacterium]KRB51131.1 hypothetical protein ASE02_14880 [Phenylobacterium sp. Root700]MBT9471541.1 hypothetical protein [Phenylobacterium sp.]